jgi:hypothetical protein
MSHGVFPPILGTMVAYHWTGVLIVVVGTLAILLVLCCVFYFIAVAFPIDLFLPGVFNLDECMLFGGLCLVISAQIFWILVAVFLACCT